MRFLAPLVLALITSLFSVTAASADTSDATRMDTGTPFAGYWDRFGLAHPSNCQPLEVPPNCGHHRVECEPAQSIVYTTNPGCNFAWGPGDWSIDDYGNNRPVFYLVSAATATITAKVWAIYPTCSGEGGASIAGSTVFVDIYANGSWEGWAAYSHLASVQVSPGRTILDRTVLGYTYMWPYLNDCWEVNTVQGVHVHHEEWNRVAYACYWNYTSGSFLDWDLKFGRIGRTIYTGVKQAC